MTGSYVEVNPLADERFSGTWLKYFKDLLTVFQKIQKRPINLTDGAAVFIKQMDAQELEFEDGKFDLVITDPPYYDNVPYSSNSDYFYVWARATLRDIFPELFLNEITPKEEELIAEPHLRGGTEKAMEFYEKGISKVFSEMYRVLKPEGLAVVVFAHKKAEAWETLIQSFIESRFVVTATWPVPMEGRTPVGKTDRAHLTSVVLVVARKTLREPNVYFDQKFQNKIKKLVQERMNEFWNQQIRGADFFMCAIGPSLKYYSQYEQILDPNTDAPLIVRDYLTFIQNIIVNFAVEQISKSAYSGNLDRSTQFYLVWRWGYGLNILPFDEIKILYQALTLDFSELENSIVRKKKTKIDYECLSPNERFEAFSQKKRQQFIPTNLIDYIQFGCYLWEIDERSQLETIINDALLKYGESFWTISQALYDLLPECHEGLQLQGILQKYKKFVPREDFTPTDTKSKKFQTTLFPSKTGKDDK
jgi:adenine-specific DNA methylase